MFHAGSKNAFNGRQDLYTAFELQGIDTCFFHYLYCVAHGLFFAYLIAAKGHVAQHESVVYSTGNGTSMINDLVNGYWQGVGVACHDIAAEGIDGGLDEDIGDGEDGALQAGGDADLEDPDKLIPMQPELPGDNVIAAVGFQHAPQYQSGGDVLRDNGGDTNAGDA